MRISNAVLLLALAPMTSGCVAAAAGVAGVVGLVQYDRNEAHRDFEVDLETAWHAAVAAVDALGFPAPEKSVLTPTEGEIEGDGYSVTVERYPEGFTCVSVRIGTFDTADHRRRAGLFLNEVASTLEG